MILLDSTPHEICVKTPRYLSYVDYCRRYSQSGDFRERAHGGPLKTYILYVSACYSGPILSQMLLWDSPPHKVCV